MLKIEMVQTAPGVFQKKKIFEEPLPVNRKADRAEELFTAIVSVNGKIFDSNEVAMNRITRILTVASAKLSKAVAEGAPYAAAYSAIFVGTSIPWKLNDNTWTTVNPEELSQVLEASMLVMQATWEKYG